MSERDRDRVDMAQLKKWLVGIGCTVLAIMIVGGIQQWIYYDIASNQASAAAQNVKDQIASECVSSTPYPKCVREILQSARTEQRNEYDLYSQQTMALWTTVMGAVASISVSLSVLGVYLIWTTYNVTLRAAIAAENTEVATRETRDSQIMTEKLSTEAKIHPSATFILSDKHCAFGLSIRNAGDTTAFAISSECRLKISRKSQMLWDSGLQPITFHPNELASRQTVSNLINYDVQDFAAIEPSEELYLIEIEGSVAFATIHKDRITVAFSSHENRRATLINNNNGSRVLHFVGSGGSNVVNEPLVVTRHQIQA